MPFAPDPKKIKCKYCSSDLSQAIAKETVGELRDKVKNSIQQFATQHYPAKAKGLFISPNIPSDKLAKAKSKYAQSITPDETPIVLYEKATIVGIMISGFILTDKRFHYFGINDYSKIGGDARNGVFDLHQIRSLVFAKESFTLNGLNSNNSNLIPLFFEINAPTEAFLNNLFGHIIRLLQDLRSNIQISHASLSQPLGSNPQSHSALSPSNPIDVGAKKEPGCFKSGCALIIGLTLLGLGLMALLGGLGFLG